MSKFSVLFYLLFILKFTSSLNDNNSVYEVPSNTKYPYGDELLFNTNLLDKNTNPFPCEDKKDLDKRLGKCPIAQTNDTSLLNPYVTCPSYAIVPPLEEFNFKLSEKPNPEIQCKKCDLKLTPDNSAVIVDCKKCFDLPSVHRQADKKEKNIIYKAFFVAIANYTTVDVTGIEYFNI